MSEHFFPLKNDTSRKIVHIDMDAFFASVEMRDDPRLQNLPVVIARHPRETGGRGVVSTCNYIARTYGIHSAMSAKKAYELCPKAVFISGNYAKYVEVSKKVREIFARYTDLVEPMSIDEAYLDVTKNKIGSKSAVKIAKMIQYDIWHELHLTCSAGVSYNKFLAKIASDWKKPAGLTIITPEDALSFLNDLPIEKFHGVGKKTRESMNEWGVFLGRDLLEKSELDLMQKFGKMGYSLYRKARGIHNSPVNNFRERKSVGKERTYKQDIFLLEVAEQQLLHLSEMVSTSLKDKKKHGRVVTLKIRYSDFSTLTKRITLPDEIYQAEDIYFNAKALFEEYAEVERGIRLLGVTVSTLASVFYENIVLPLDCVQ
ncbi:DNA polymerase-4 [Pilibacter termitis]|uniref:DNA polymerase IV n=1 Tax=Pilibacter termitis TaxID=263852 RepID=A0A1T4L2U6_9ENTE|nr:DNA polymerase IV [Pilibacter termitis]SJZ49036.1 DNA polymerase-4 [Pilibacter termitis]